MHGAQRQWCSISKDFVIILFFTFFFSPPGTRKPCLSLLWAVEKKRAAGNESGLEGSDSGGSRFSSLLLPCNHVILSNLVPPLVTLVSDGAGQSGDWKRQVRHGKVCQLQGKAFQSQLPPHYPISEGCEDQMVHVKHVQARH